MKKILYFLALIFSVALYAQDGTLDTSFNPMDKGTGTGFSDIIKGTKNQSDGKLLVNGDFLSYNGVPNYGLVRLNIDGSLDSSFNSNIYFPDKVSLQSDGKLIISRSSSINRLNADGSFDSTFKKDLIYSTYSYNATGITIQGDDKILFNATDYTISSNKKQKIVRLNADGSFDTTFILPELNSTGLVYQILILPDGKILICGSFTACNNVSRNKIARLNSDGTLDTSFNPGFGANGDINSMRLDADGKIYLSGYFSNYNNASVKPFIRINADGSLDNSFVFTQSGSDNSIIQFLDGKILIKNKSEYPYTNRFLRLNLDGSLDTTFTNTNLSNNLNKIVSGNNFGTSIMPDGKILLYGNFSFLGISYKNNLVGLDSEGFIDKTFNPNTGANESITKMSLQNDGKILINGDFTSYNGTYTYPFPRINSDGSLDTSFNLYPRFGNTISSVTPQLDGKFLVSGYFTAIDGVAVKYMVRLNADQSLDQSFVADLSKSPSGVHLLKDGKILLHYVQSFGTGGLGGSLKRLNADGSVDKPSIGIGQGLYNIPIISSLISFPDGKIIFSGKESVFYSDYTIYRLNTDGSLDSTLGYCDKPVYSIKTQTDGKILLAGDFTTYKGIIIKSIARANSDGTLDGTFNPGLGANGAIYSMALQEDGKILIAGDFTTYNGIPANRIAKLNSDGSLDTSFNSGTGFNNVVRNIILQADGKILASGDFTSYNGIGKNRILRLNNTVSLSTVDISKNKQIVIYPNPVKNILNIKTDESISGYEIYSLDGRKLTTENNVNNFKVDVSHLTKGDYLIKIKSKGKEQTAKFIKQ